MMIRTLSPPDDSILVLSTAELGLFLHSRRHSSTFTCLSVRSWHARNRSSSVYMSLYCSSLFMVFVFPVLVVWTGTGSGSPLFSMESRE